MDFLLKIQHSGFCQWVRESESIFSYSGILLLHTIGMGFVVGINACIDLRILGFAPAIRLAGLEKYFPMLWAGFWVNAATGTILLAIDIVDKLSNVDFYIKMAFIALAVVCLPISDPVAERNKESSMNSVEIHLLLNHFPTVGFSIGLGLFLVSLFGR